MGGRSYVPFDVFSMQVDVPVSTLVRDRDLGWTCGQCPLDRQGQVVSPGDLLAQTRFVCDMIEGVVQRGGFDLVSLGKLNVYFMERLPGEGHAALSIIRDRFRGLPVIVPIPIPHFYYDGMMIEIDVFAGAGARLRKSRTSVHSDLQIVETDEIVWASVRVDLPEDRAISEALVQMRTTLEKEDLHADNLISDHWFAPVRKNRPASEMACVYETNFITNPDALVFVDARMSSTLVCDLTFSTKPTRIGGGVDDSGLKLLRRNDGKFLFISGVDADSDCDLIDQTKAIMSGIEQALASERMSFANVLKLTTHYVGEPTPEELHGNMEVRHSYYSNPGPASTGLPVTALLNPECRISIDVVAAV